MYRSIVLSAVFALIFASPLSANPIAWLTKLYSSGATMSPKVAPSAIPKAATGAGSALATGKGAIVLEDAARANPKIGSGAAEEEGGAGSTLRKGARVLGKGARELGELGKGIVEQSIQPQYNDRDDRNALERRRAEIQLMQKSPDAAKRRLVVPPMRQLYRPPAALR